MKDKKRESREIKEERENSSGKDLEVITTRRQRGERSTQESPGRLLDLLGQNLPLLQIWSHFFLFWNQFLDFEGSRKLGDRAGLCMIHSEGCVSQRIWPW